MSAPTAPGYVPGRLFQDYHHALQTCQAGAYEFEELVNVVVEKTRVFNRGLASHRTIELGLLRALIGIGLANRSGQPTAVLDFGGAAGHHHSIVEAAFGCGSSLDWRVVETSAMAARARAVIRKDNLHFFDSIDAAAWDCRKFDIVFTSGALQCCPDPLRFLKDLTELRADHLFITRTQFSDCDREFVTVERSLLSDNGPGPLPPGFVDRSVYYPNTYAPKSKVEEILQANYEITLCIHEDPPYLFANSQPVNRYYGYLCRLRGSGTGHLPAPGYR